jgi:hypothetical protein
VNLCFLIDIFLSPALSSLFLYASFSLIHWFFYTIYT